MPGPLDAAPRAPRLRIDGSRSRATPQGLIYFLGSDVQVERLDGTILVGRVKELGMCNVLLAMPTRAVAVVPIVQIRRLRLSGQGAEPGSWFFPDPPLVPCSPQLPMGSIPAPDSPSSPAASLGSSCAQRLASGACPPCTQDWGRRQLYFEFAGFRFTAGMQMAIDFFEGYDTGWTNHWGFELIPFTLRFGGFYLEPARVGFGSLGLTYGVALGYAARLGSSGRHELRIGAHVTFFYFILPTLSGLQLTYVARVSRYFAVEVGLMQYSYPTAVALTFGFRI